MSRCLRKSKLKFSICAGFACLAFVLLFKTGLYAGTIGKSDTVTVVMVGDMLMHDKVIKSGSKPDGTYDYDHLFENVKDEIEGADIAIVNQETILGGERLKFTGYPSFNSPFEVGDAEVKAGFDVILHGTNHALDRSAAGIDNCLEFWDIVHPEEKILGIHDSAEDQDRLCVIRAGGISFAILNYTYGTNGIQMPQGRGYLVDYLSEKKVREDIKRAEAAADLTIVCPHWGTEYSLEESGYQKKWARIFYECGVDLVIGTHPHVIEPFEIYEGEDGRKMSVYYSLGNFVNSTSGSGSGVMNRMVGGMAVIKAGRDASGKAVILENAVHPLVCHISKDSVTVYFLEDYTEEMAEENLIKKQDPAFSLKKCRELVEKVWGDGSVDIIM